MTPPNAAQAKALVQCDYEAKSRLTARLPCLQTVSNLTVEMGPQRKFKDGDGYAGEFPDKNAPVYDLNGMGTSVQCLQTKDAPTGKNCSTFLAKPGGGICWRSSLGNWLCSMFVNDLISPTELPTHVPEGPRSY